MGSKWNFEHPFVLPATLVFLAISVGEALAASILVHQSREDYFQGATHVTGCTGQDGISLGEGCRSTDFWINQAGAFGPSLWEVVEKVYKDSAAGTTDFRYTIINDSLTSGGSLPPPGFSGSGIASFNVPNSGVGGSMFAPATWTVPTVSPLDNGTFWHWETETPTADIASGGGSLGCDIPGTPITACFRVLVNRIVPVGFNFGVSTDLGTTSHLLFRD